MAAVDIDQMRNHFNEEFEKLVSVKGLNCFYINNTQYDELLNDVMQAKKTSSLTTLQRRRLKRYDICSIGGVRKLVVPLTKGESSRICFIKNEEMFNVLYDTHLSVKHGGKHRMLAELKKKYKNVTQEIVLLFLKLCPTCQIKQKSIKKEIVTKPIVSTQMNSRCHVDLIDMQFNPDDLFKFIMVYQDHWTKFIQLRPLTCNAPTEVAKQLLDIFCIFGAPEILQSDNGYEFIHHTIEELRSMWKGLNIVQGNPQYNSQLQGGMQEAVTKDVENRLATWMAMENCNQWSEGLKFVQFMKNQFYRDDIKASPYKAMFGTDAKIGLSTSGILPKEACESIRTEEDLVTFLDSVTQLPQKSKSFLEESEDEEIQSDIEASEHLEIITSVKDEKQNSHTEFDRTIDCANEQTDSVHSIFNQNTVNFQNNINKRKRI